MVSGSVVGKTSTTSPIRIWKGVYEPYRDLGKDARITISDLISLVLYHTAFDEPLIIYILQEEFGIDFDTAKEYATKLAEAMEQVGKMIWGEEHEEEA